MSLHMAASKNKRPQFKRRKRPEPTPELEAFINGADEEVTAKAQAHVKQKPKVAKTQGEKSSSSLLKPKKKPEIKLFNLRLSTDLHRSIDELADTLNLSMHEVLLTLVEKGIEKERKVHGLD